MSFQINVPPSLVAKIKKNEQIAEEEKSTEKKREDWRKIKELEEARKAGTAPAMQDEEGKDINPHIPQYIMQAPWYIGALQPTLKHQREPDERKKSYSSLNEWYSKGVKEGPVATKFREGACSNCGAMTHKKKDCFERPRKIGAEFTGSNIAPDEFKQPELEFNYESKRDRWNGYDPANHKKIFEEFQKMEEVRRELKAKKLDKSLMEGGDGAVEDDAREDDEEEDGDGDEDDEKYADSMAMPGQKFETKQRITVRNLRIREDTAKYLYNLDPNSAFYDPKTRSMRENPFKDRGVDPKELPYAGDNFVRWSGDAYEIAKKQKFAWEAYEKGSDVHVQAEPTKLELLNKEYQKKKDMYKDKQWSSIVEKYGGQEHLDVPPKHLLLAQTEEYVEYSRHGTVVKGSEKAVVRSRYEEDVMEKNHTLIWGSFWKDGSWGYKCCESLVRGSYCIGRAGLQQKLQDLKDEEEEEDGNDDDEREDEKSKTSHSTKDDSQKLSSTTEDTTNETTSNTKSLLHQHLEKLQAEEKQKRKEERKRKKRSKKKKNKRKKHKKNDESKDKEHDDSSSDEESSDEDDDDEEKKVKKAIQKEKERLKEVDKLMKLDEKRRPYNVMYDGKGPTEDDIEAYQRLRMRPDDPMANYVDDNR